RAMKQRMKRTTARSRFPGRPAKDRLAGHDRPDVTPAFDGLVVPELPRDEAPVATAEDETRADDALTLYLHQMGAISLLSRDKELELARRLEAARARYRHAVLFSWPVLGRLVEKFEQART